MGLNVLLARYDLAGLDAEARTMNEKPIVKEVAKAVTVAVLHPGVEARVVCHTVEDVTDAVTMLAGQLGKREGLEWNDAEKCFELPNGSAVVVKAAARRREREGR